MPGRARRDEPRPDEERLPAAPLGKRFPHGRPIKLGVAARLYPVKGVALVLHAVAALRATLDVVLTVAGAGPERPKSS